MLRGLSDAEIATLYWHWDFWARPDQLPPVGDWSAWMMLGGRGAGKTRAAAEWVRARIEAPPHQHPPRRIALIGETFAAALSRSGDWRRHSL
jgi:phage terminase large subunit-like protein